MEPSEDRPLTLFDYDSPNNKDNFESSVNQILTCFPENVDNNEMKPDNSEKIPFFHSLKPIDSMISPAMSPADSDGFNVKDNAPLKCSSIIQTTYDQGISNQLDIPTADDFFDNNVKGEAANNDSAYNVQSTGGTNQSFSLYDFRYMEKKIFNESQEPEGDMEIENEDIQHSAVDSSKNVQNNLDAPLSSDLSEQDSVVSGRQEMQEEIKEESEPIQNTTVCGSNEAKKSNPYKFKNLPKNIFVGVRKGCWSYWGKKGGIYLSCISNRLRRLDPRQEENLKRFLNECHEPGRTWESLKTYIANYTRRPEHYEVVGIFHDMLIDLVSRDQDFYTWIKASKMKQKTKDKIIANRKGLIDEIKDKVH